MTDLTRRSILGGLLAGVAAAVTPKILVPEIVKEVDLDELAYFGKPEALRPKSFSGWRWPSYVSEGDATMYFDGKPWGHSPVPAEYDGGWAMHREALGQVYRAGPMRLGFPTIWLSGRTYEVEGGLYDYETDMVTLRTAERIKLLDVETRRTVNTNGGVLAEALVGNKLPLENHDSFQISGQVLAQVQRRHGQQGFDATLSDPNPTDKLPTYERFLWSDVGKDGKGLSIAARTGEEDDDG